VENQQRQHFAPAKLARDRVAAAALALCSLGDRLGCFGGGLAGS
jgi:hypothetical protein